MEPSRVPGVRRRPWRRLCAAIASLSVLALTGCGGSGATASAPPAGAAAAAQRPITLQFADSEVVGSAEYQAVTALLQKWNSSHPDVQVKFDNLPYASAIQKLTAEVAGGQTPDVALLLDRWATALIGQNALLPLDPYLPSGYASQFDAKSWDYGSAGGHAYAIPLFANVQALLYNKTLLDKAHISVPTSLKDAWSFTQLVQVAQEVKARTGVPYGFAYWDASTPSRLSQYLVAAGGSVLSPDFKTATLDSQVGVNMLAEIQKTFQEGLVPPDNWSAPSVNPDPMYEDFVNEKIAMLTGSGNFQVAQLSKDVGNRFQWGFAFMPTTLGTPIELVVFKGTKYPKQAAQFIQWMAEPQNMTYMAVNANTIPTRTNINVNSIQWKHAPGAMKVLVEELPAASPQIQGEMKKPYWSDIDLMLRQVLEQLSLGQLTPKQAAREGTQKAQQIIAQYRPS